MNTPNSQVTEQARRLLADQYPGDNCAYMRTLICDPLIEQRGVVETAVALRAIEAALTARAEEGFVVGLLRSFADRVIQAEPWLHKGNRFTKWAKDLASDLNEAADRIAARPQPAQGDGWLPIESAPVGRAVLVAVEYSKGKAHVLRAIRAEKGTLPLGDDQEPWDGCFDDGDNIYCAPGWYERNQYDETNWQIADKVLGWRPLPPPPAPADGGTK